MRPLIVFLLLMALTGCSSTFEAVTFSAYYRTRQGAQVGGSVRLDGTSDTEKENQMASGKGTWLYVPERTLPSTK